MSRVDAEEQMSRVDAGAGQRAAAQGERCMVVGCDGSIGALGAAEWAAGQMQGNGTLVLVHACKPLLQPPAALSTPEERIEIGYAEVGELLIGAAGPLTHVDVEVEVLDQDPVSAILEVAAAHAAEAIVIGSEHGRSRLNATIGILAGELLKAAAVPVIAVPEPAAAPTRAEDWPDGVYPTAPAPGMGGSTGGSPLRP